MDIIFSMRSLPQPNHTINNERTKSKSYSTPIYSYERQTQGPHFQVEGVRSGATSESNVEVNFLIIDGNSEISSGKTISS